MKDGKSGLTERIARMPPARRILLARWLAASGWDAPEVPILPIERDCGTAYDLSLAQHGIWLVEQLHPQNAAYNLAVAARIVGRLDSVALRRSFEVLANHHEGLRVELASNEGLPVMRVSSEPETELLFVDVDGLPEAARRCSEEAKRPFDLTRGALWRAVLFRIGEHDHAIVLVIHHILSDNWSMGILARELAICYAALAAGQAIVLPELPIQYIDFAVWQRRRFQRGALDGELSYWRRELERAALAPLPGDRARPAVQSHRGSRCHLRVSTALSASLRVLAIREGVTLFMVLVAGLQALMHRYTGEDRIVIGTDVAGRCRAELEGLIGLFVNQIVLCTDLSDNPTLRETLARVRRTCLGAYAHQEVPFHKVVGALNPTRSLDRTPLFQVKIDLLSVPMGAASLPGLDVTPIPLEGTAKFDLELVLWDTADGLYGFIEYCTDLFDASTIDRTIADLTTLFEQFAADPAQRVLDVPLRDEHCRGVQFESDDAFSFDA
jgi:hypothetical protein